MSIYLFMYLFIYIFIVILIYTEKNFKINYFSYKFEDES